MKKRIFFWVLLGLILFFIWGNSMLSMEDSKSFSSAVGDFLSKIFGLESGDGGGDTMIGGIGLRKIAHFVEFCALGVIFSLILRLYIKDTCITLLSLALFGFIVPMIDETIQIFSGRGPMVSDVWIDVGGYALGCILLYFGLYLGRLYLKNNHKN